MNVNAEARTRTITVYGDPQTQGSKSARVFHGKAILTEGFGDGPRRRKAWRTAVAEAARAWLKEHDGPEPLDGPLILEATFYLARPASAPKRVLYPIRKPDASKLIRSAEDALTKIWYTDDARIVDLIVHKRFATGGPPRATITLREML